MRDSASEKAEIIQLVEQSPLLVKHTLEKLGIPRATFYRWCDLYQSGGPEAMSDRSPRPNRVWNRIPDKVRDQIIKLALRTGALAARTRPALHRHGKLFRVRGFGLSPAKGT
jgi:putative transposase